MRRGLLYTSVHMNGFLNLQNIINVCQMILASNRQYAFTFWPFSWNRHCSQRFLPFANSMVCGGKLAMAVQ